MPSWLTLRMRDKVKMAKFNIYSLIQEAKFECTF